VLVDPDASAVPDFRVEKISASQFAQLGRTGLSDRVLRRFAYAREASISSAPYWTAQRWARFIAWSVQG
jgi:hypothetical protein